MSDPTAESFESSQANDRVPGPQSPRHRPSPFEHAAGWIATLHPGEGRTAARFCATACLLMICYYVLKTLREPLLLVDGSAELKSYAHAAIAAVLLVVVPLYGVLYRRTDRQRLVRYITLFFITNLLLFHAAGRAGVDVGFAYYVWVGTFGVLMPVQLWAHAASTYRPESGQRLFPLIMVGAAAGSLVGPKLASGLYSSLGAWNLMVLGAVLLAVMLALLERTAACVATVAGGDDGERDDGDRDGGGRADGERDHGEHDAGDGQRSRRQDDVSSGIGASTGASTGTSTGTGNDNDNDNDNAASDTKTTLLGGFALVLRDRYLMLLAVVAVLLNCVNSMGEYLLGDFVERDAAARIAAEPHLDAGELITSFYGDFHFTVNGLNLILQIFLVARIFRWVGVQGALLVLPAIAILGYGLIAFVPVFAMVHIVKLVENSTDYSVMNTARHALYLPLPASHKYQGKTAIDTFFWRLGDMVQAAIVYVGLNIFDFGPGHFALVGAVLALAWIFVAARVGERYPVRPPQRITLRSPWRAPVRSLCSAPLRSLCSAPVRSLCSVPLRSSQLIAISRRTLATAAATTVFAVTASTLPLNDADAHPALFAESQPIAMTIEANFRSLCRSRRECEDAPATLVYADANGTLHRISASIRARGKWRAESDNCSVPPLFVTILDTAASAAVLGEHPPVLPLTTHCREKPGAYEQYVLKEYLAYRLYSALTDQSLRVRLARITYQDSRRRGRTVERYGLFVEHFDALAARLGGTILQPSAVQGRDLDPLALATFALFQYMIGNTDWSVVAGHNVLHVRARDGSVVAVPYDFDFSGLVNASYALPPEQLPIRKVTQRLFRGACSGETDWRSVFDAFANKREEVERLVAETPGLEPKHRMEVARFLRGFFAVLESPGERERIIERCRGS